MTDTKVTIMVGTDNGEWIREEMDESTLAAKVASGELRRCHICDDNEEDKSTGYDDGLPSYHNY